MGEVPHRILKTMVPRHGRGSCFLFTISASLSHACKILVFTLAGDTGMEFSPVLTISTKQWHGKHSVCVWYTCLRLGGMKGLHDYIKSSKSEWNNGKIPWPFLLCRLISSLSSSHWSLLLEPSISRARMLFLFSRGSNSATHSAHLRPCPQANNFISRSLRHFAFRSNSLSQRKHDSGFYSTNFLLAIHHTTYLYNQENWRSGI